MHFAVRWALIRPCSSGKDWKWESSRNGAVIRVEIASKEKSALPRIANSSRGDCLIILLMYPNNNNWTLTWSGNCGWTCPGMARAPSKSSALTGKHRHKSMSMFKFNFSHTKCIVEAIPDSHSVLSSVVTLLQPDGKLLSNISINSSMNLERKVTSRNSILPEWFWHSVGRNSVTDVSLTYILIKFCRKTIWKYSLSAKYSITTKKSSSSRASILSFSQLHFRLEWVDIFQSIRKTFQVRISCHSTWSLLELIIQYLCNYYKCHVCEKNCPKINEIPGQWKLECYALEMNFSRI